MSPEAAHTIDGRDPMSKHTRTPWTTAERNEFVQWHESVIVRYPDEIVRELRRARQILLKAVRIVA